MSVSRRKLYSLRATVSYIVFACTWILLSDRVLEVFADAHTIARYSSLKGLFFIGVTAAILWLTLQNAPSEAETRLPQDNQTPSLAIQIAWGVALPALALLLEWTLWMNLSPLVWLLFYPAVFLASWVGGRLAGLIATLLSTAAGCFALTPLGMTTNLPAPTMALATGIFFGMGVLFSLTNEWLRQAEQRSGNSKFQALVEQSLAGIYIVQNNVLRYANPEFAKMLGFDSPDQLIDKVPIGDLVMPEHRHLVLQNLKRRHEDTREEVRYAFTARRRDGTPVELEVHGRGVQTATGPAVIGLALDVSERRRTEAALRRSEQLLRAVVDGTTDAVFVKDWQGVYLMANQACANFVGLPVEGIIGRDDHALFSAESAALLIAQDRAIMEGGKTVTSEEALTMRNGRQLTFLVTKGPMFDDQGQVIGLFGLSRDVTAIIEGQNALKARQRVLDRMSALAKVGGWVIDTNTSNVQGTRTEGAASILGLDPTQPASLVISDGLRFFSDQDRHTLTQALHRAVQFGEGYDLILQMTSAIGEHKWIRTQGEPVWENGRVVRVEGALQDVSEVQEAKLALQAHQQQLEETVRVRTAELELARQEAERLTRVKSDFLANMSHEIRTPLNGVLGLAQVGQMAHNDEAGALFGQIVASGNLLLGIVNDILDFSKIEAGKLHIESLPVPLPELLIRVVESVQGQAQFKGIAVKAEISPHVPTTCLSDPLRLEQILLNLLTNAIKFTPEGGVSLTAQRRDDEVVMLVSDTGIGMSPEQLNGLFRPFEQADGSTTRQYGGTGLGLSITKRLVELLGGRIAVTSQLGRGTQFEITLPLVLDASGAAPSRSPSEQTEPPTGPRLHGLRVLAAEDNVVNQIVLKEFLRIEGAQVTMVNCGADAIDQLQQQGPQSFDVVLMDIQMPDMDGHEATRQIKALAPSLPVIGQSAHALHEERIKCQLSGMSDLVVKPLDIDILVATILRHARA